MENILKAAAVQEGRRKNEPRGSKIDHRKRKEEI
jgi:hypothetical protein